MKMRYFPGAKEYGMPPAVVFYVRDQIVEVNFGHRAGYAPLKYRSVSLGPVQIGVF